jgi:hypothetical protein
LPVQAQEAALLLLFPHSCVNSAAHAGDATAADSLLVADDGTACAAAKTRCDAKSSSSAMRMPTSKAVARQDPNFGLLQLLYRWAQPLLWHTRSPQKVTI